MRRALQFSALSAVLISAAAWIGIAVFSTRLGENGVRAVVTSAGVAFTVQMLTYGIVSMAVSTNVIAGWVAGMLVRFMVLAMHGFFGARLLGLPLAASLLSLASFFFLTSLVEPFFLPRPPGPPPAVRTPS